MFNKTIPRGGDGAGRGGAGWVKSHPIPAPPPLRGGENPHGAKRGGAGQAEQCKIAIPNIFDKIDIKTYLEAFLGVF